MRSQAMRQFTETLHSMHRLHPTACAQALTGLRRLDCRHAGKPKKLSCQGSHVPCGNMEWQSANVIHVRVRYEYMALIDCSLRAPPCVKDQLQLRDADAGLLRA